jgi:hypothetical protein
VRELTESERELLKWRLAHNRLVLAAPDLLAAAKRLIEMRDGCPMTHEDAYYCMFKSDGSEQWDALAAAIAKATGETL